MRYLVDTQETIHIRDLHATELNNDSSGNQLTYKLLAR